LFTIVMVTLSPPGALLEPAPPGELDEPVLPAGLPDAPLPSAQAATLAANTRATSRHNRVFAFLVFSMFWFSFSLYYFSAGRFVKVFRGTEFYWFITP